MNVPNPVQRSERARCHIIPTRRFCWFCYGLALGVVAAVAAWLTQ